MCLPICIYYIYIYMIRAYILRSRIPAATDSQSLCRRRRSIGTRERVKTSNPNVYYYKTVHTRIMYNNVRRAFPFVLHIKYIIIIITNDFSMNNTHFAGNAASIQQHIRHGAGGSATVMTQARCSARYNNNIKATWNQKKRQILYYIL